MQKGALLPRIPPFMTSHAGPSPYFDFQSQVTSPDIGFLATDTEAFSFSPLSHRFVKFRLYECSSHFFVFGSESTNKRFSVLQIVRDEGQIEEHAIVSVPALADDIRCPTRTPNCITTFLF